MVIISISSAHSLQRCIMQLKWALNYNANGSGSHESGDERGNKQDRKMENKYAGWGNERIKDALTRVTRRPHSLNVDDVVVRLPQPRSCTFVSLKKGKAKHLHTLFIGCVHISVSARALREAYLLHLCDDVARHRRNFVTERRINAFYETWMFIKVLSAAD